MESVVLASEAVDAVREYFAATGLLFAVSFVCLGVGVLLMRLNNHLELARRKQTVVTWKTLALTVALPAVAVVIALFASTALSQVVTLGLYGLTVLGIGAIVLRIVAMLARTV